MGGECSMNRRRDKYEKNFSRKYEVSNLGGNKRHLSSPSRRTRLCSGRGCPPLKIENVTISLKRTYFYLVRRKRINGAVPPPSLMPLRLAKGTLQILCECVEMIVPCVVARPLWLLYCMSVFAIHRQFLAITMWTILLHNLPPSQQATQSTPTLYKTLQSEQPH